VHALDVDTLALDGEFDGSDVREAMAGHVLASARVTASSSASHEQFTRRQVTADTIHPLNMPRAVMFPRGNHRHIENVQLLLRNDRSQPVEVIAHVRDAAKSGDFSSSLDLATSTATVPAQSEKFITFPLDIDIEAPMLWIWLPKTEGVSWRLMTKGPHQACRAYGGGGKRPWTVVEGQYYAACTEPPLTYDVDCRPENVMNGVARIVGRELNLWASDPDQPMPQQIELTFSRPRLIDTVYLTFDTDMNAAHHTVALVPQCVRDYELSGVVDGRLHSLAVVKENFQRRRRHQFEPVRAEKIIVRVTATNGDPSARLFEIRAYHEGS